MLDAPINREPVATRARSSIDERFGVTAGLEDRRGKDLVPDPFHPDFHSVSPCPNEFFPFFFPLFPRFIYERDVSEEEISQDERSFLFLSLSLEIFSRRDSSLEKILRNVNV